MIGKRSIYVRVVLEHSFTHEIVIVVEDFEELLHGNSNVKDLDLFNGHDGIWYKKSFDIFTGKYDVNGKQIFENDITNDGTIEWVCDDNHCGFMLRDYEHDELHDFDSLMVLEVLGNLHVNEYIYDEMKKRSEW